MFYDDRLKLLHFLEWVFNTSVQQKVLYVGHNHRFCSGKSVLCLGLETLLVVFVLNAVYSLIYGFSYKL